jgi:hypothetical protein
MNTAMSELLPGMLNYQQTNKLKNIYVTSNLTKLLCKSRYQTETQRWIINKHQARKDVHNSVSHMLYCISPLTQEVKWQFSMSCHHESSLPVETGQRFQRPCEHRAE